MTDRVIELQQYLEGLTSDMPRPFYHLAEVFEHQVFELCRIGEEEEKTYAVPYMLNDAVEDYLILNNCRMVGEYVKQKESDTTAYIAKEDDEYVLSVRQGSENAFILRFSDMEEKVRCYQYHRIGHFWVKGQENWRQLVYMIGTIYDKYEYLGESFCNPQEMDLIRLMEFAPFREWSPIHESLEDQYPATYEGIDTMKRYAQEAKDIHFLRWISIYRKFPSQKLEKILSKKLLKPKRQTLYDVLWEKVKAASEAYPERKYGHGLDARMQEERCAVHLKMTALGYEGAYPEYRKDNRQVIVTEEHPYTIMDMEYEDYSFRMQFMVSECRNGNIQGRNSGFFQGNGRKGWIAKSLEEIKGV